MIRLSIFAALIAAALFAQSQRPAFESFDVATIKPTAPDGNGSRYIRMEGAQFVARNHEMRRLIAAAWNLTPRAVLGGPAWIDSDHFDIFAKPPGDVRPGYDEQMVMLRALITERFHLTFHREPKDYSIYSLTVAKNGPKLKETDAPADAQAEVVNTVFPEKDGGVYLHLPARNATMTQFTAMLQRGVFDRPVVDNTGLTRRYDFDLEWSPDDAQFNGAFTRPPGAGAPTKADIFSAIQDQLGLRLEATRGPVSTLVIDKIERPTDN